MAALIKMSRRGWMMIVRWTVLGTLSCNIVAVIIHLLAFRDLGPAALDRSIVTAILIPILLAGPLFFYLTLKLRELAIVNHKLNVLASTDSLTSCLNRGAFSESVNKLLATSAGGRAACNGALLVIDADHFKTINDRFGHDHGDFALRIIAGSIKDAVRGGDLVGRLGGEEFGVFLPEADAGSAADIADRIRRAVDARQFWPNGRHCDLSVSVGAAAFEKPASFEDLFRVADKCLYEAKNAGRNRIVLSQIPALYYDEPAERAPALPN